MRLRSLYLAVFLLQFLHALTQTLPSRRYTTRDGLVADRVTVITQDHNGFMWMGSLFGLCRYDGTRFTVIKLPAAQQHKSVTSLLAADGKVYAGFIFGGGLIEYDKGQITAHYIKPGEKGVSNDIAGLYDDPQGILVVNAASQVYRFQNEKFEHVFTADTPLSISALASQPSGNMWVGTNKGLYVLENGKLRSGSGPHGHIYYIRNTGNGLMVVWSEAGITYFELFDQQMRGKIIWQTQHFRPAVFFANQQNSYWGIDLKRGLFNMSAQGRIDFFAANLNPSIEIKYMFADRENNLWMATDPGVLKISNLPAISYEFEELAPGGGDLAISKDSITWCTNSKHLYLVSGNQLLKAQEFRGKDNGGYLGVLITDDQNNLWISRWEEGLWKLQYKKDKLISRKYFSHYKGKEVIINCLVSDDEGNIWAGGPAGIFHIRDGEIIGRHDVLWPNGTTAFITAIAADPLKKELWLGENTGGIIKLSFKSQGNTFSYKVEEHLNDKHGLTDTYVRSLVFDSKSNLWVGTRLGGIFKMETKGSSGYAFRHYGSATGITCSRVTDITEEKGKAIWFATCDGVFRFLLETGTWQSYKVSEGLLGSETFAVTVDARNQRAWAVSGQGITNMRYGIDKNSRPAPQVNITQVSVLGKEDTAALFLQHPKKLSSDENSIGFTFAGTSYTDERKIRYKYMLEGYDKEWSPPMQTNNVNYASLPFGTYTFKVMASTGDKWSEQPATFSFQVVRPFYKSFWFLALVICMIGLSFYFIRVYRLKQRLKLEKLRMNIARDLHDDIGSALGSINLLSENATRRLAANRSVEEVAGVFQKIGRSAQNMLDSMDDIIWTINPEKDSMEDLLIRMREFAIPLLEARNISFEIAMNANEGIKPSLEIKRNIYLIFKEAIFNVVRHSGSTHVVIKASFGARSYDLSITDNGKGFNTSTLNGRNGLKNMRKRAGLSGASLQVISSPGTGTSIRLQGVIR